MPHDRIELAPSPDLVVMTRVLRLPTVSRHRALKIVALQLDRLSPIPATEIAWDLALVSRNGAEGVFVFGLIRKTLLPEGQPRVIVQRQVEEWNATLTFRNPLVSHGHEERLLKRAPSLVLTSLCAAGLVLSITLKIDEWRATQLEQSAVEARFLRQQAVTERAEDDTRRLWLSTERTDAGMEWLCLTARMPPSSAGSLVASSVEITSTGTSVTSSAASTLQSLQALGGEAQGQRVFFGADLCR